MPRSPIAMLRSFLVFRGHRQPYSRKARGTIYVLIEIPDQLLDQFEEGKITATDVLAGSAIKAGHTNDLDRRRSNYRKCGGGGSTHLWIGKYSVSQRYFIERWLHLRLFCAGGVRVDFDLPCQCGVRHREYMTFDSVGGLAALDAEMRTMGHAMGENFKMTLLAPPPAPVPGGSRGLRDIFYAICKS